MSSKLVKKVIFKGRIIINTGLHIGGTNSNMQIGGIDKGVVRNPFNNQPFIPGSSLKGKLRSLLEISLGIIGSKVNDEVENGPAKHGPSAELFGNAISDKDINVYKENGIELKHIPSRLIVRDCELKNAEKLLEKTEMPYTEGKTEVVIDRITSKATPRQIERVPAGAEFELNMVLNIWEQDKNEKDLIDNLFKSLELLKDDYLGGSGSRGYGQVTIYIQDILEKKVNGYYDQQEAKPENITNKYENRIKKLRE